MTSPKPKRKTGWIWGLIIAAVLGIAVVTAMQMGETSHAYARGRVEVDTDLISRAQGVSTLFITVLRPDAPMPVAAMRTTIGSVESDLYNFVLTKESMQVMQPGMPWPEEFRVKARLDVDGQGGPDSPGDLVGTLDGVKLGARDIVVKIDRVVQ